LFYNSGTGSTSTSNFRLFHVLILSIVMVRVCVIIHVTLGVTHQQGQLIIPKHLILFRFSLYNLLVFILSVYLIVVFLILLRLCSLSGFNVVFVLFSLQTMNIFNFNFRQLMFFKYSCRSCNIHNLHGSHVKGDVRL